MKYTKTTEQRLQQLEDKQSILELKYRYLNACDEKQPEVVTNCFISGYASRTKSGFFRAHQQYSQD